MSGIVQSVCKRKMLPSLPRSQTKGIRMAVWYDVCTALNQISLSLCDCSKTSLLSSNSLQSPPLPLSNGVATSSIGWRPPGSFLQVPPFIHAVLLPTGKGAPQPLLLYLTSVHHPQVQWLRKEGNTSANVNLLH